MCITRACNHYVVGATLTYRYQDSHVTRTITRASLLNLLLSIFMNCMIQCFALSCAWIFKRWKSEKKRQKTKRTTRASRQRTRCCFDLYWSACLSWYQCRVLHFYAYDTRMERVYFYQYKIYVGNTYVQPLLIIECDLWILCWTRSRIVRIRDEKA
jgi:hypothetical protein